MGGFQTELLENMRDLGFLSPDAIQTLIEHAASRGASLAEAALLESLLHSDAKGWILAEALGIPFLEVDPDTVSLSLCDVLPEALARENLMVPIARENDRLTLAVADPFCHEAFSAVESMTGLPVRLVICPRRTLAAILSRFGPFQLSPADPRRPYKQRGGGKVGGAGGVRRCEKALLHAAATDSITSGCSRGGKVLLNGRKAGTCPPVLPLRFRRILIDAFVELAGRGKGPRRIRKGLPSESASGVVSFRLSFVQGLSGAEGIIKVLPDQKDELDSGLN